jgi:hypothetical protein
MANRKSAPKSKIAAQAESFVPQATTQMFEEGLEKAQGFARMYSDAAETGVKTVAKQAAASTEMLRTLGERNVAFMTRTFEQGVETAEALTAAKDPRTAFDIQSSFAKAWMAEYTKEVGVQTEMWMNAWREAAKTVSRTAR